MKKIILLLFFLPFSVDAGTDIGLIDLAGGLNPVHQGDLRQEVVQFDKLTGLKTVMTLAYAANCVGFENRITAYQKDIRIHLNCETNSFRLELSERAWAFFLPEGGNREAFIADILQNRRAEKTSMSRMKHFNEILDLLFRYFFDVKNGTLKPDLKIIVNGSATYKDNEIIYVPEGEEELVFRFKKDGKILTEKIKWSYQGIEAEKPELKLKISDLEAETTSIRLRYRRQQIIVQIQKVKIGLKELAFHGDGYNIVSNAKAKSVITDEEQISLLQRASLYNLPGVYPKVN